MTELVSIKLYGNAEVTVYEHGSQSGDRARIMANTYELDTLEDEITSFTLRVAPSKNFACLFEHPGFRGTPICLPAGSQTSNVGSVFNDKASSLLLGGAAEIKMYEDGGYSGSSTTRSVSRAYLSDIGFDDKVTGYKVTVNNKDDWEHSVELADKLGHNAKFFDQHFLSTHNSSTSDDYVANFGLGTNQGISIYQQLELGARVIELDPHGTNSNAYFCHATDCGFSGLRVNAKRLFNEINTFLDTHPEAFIVVRNEDHLNDGEYDDYKAALTNSFGSKLYTPSGTSCGQAVPSSTRLGDRIAAGQRILFMGLDCGSSGVSDVADTIFAYTSHEIGRNSDFSNCGFVARTTRHTRVVESDNIFANDRVADSDLTPATRCGINSIGLDHVQLSDVGDSDGRFTRQFWTWLENHPSDSARCAYAGAPSSSSLRALATFRGTSSCGTTRKYLCRNSSDNLVVSNGQGSHGQGASVCANEGHSFTTPITPVEANELINNHIPQAGTVWVNLKSSNGESWSSPQ